MGFSDLTKPLDSLPNILSGKIPGIGGSQTSYGLDTGFHGTLPGVLEDKLYKFKSKALSHVPWLNVAIGFDNPKWPLGREFKRGAANADATNKLGEGEFKRGAANADATNKLGDLIAPTEPGPQAANNMWGNIASNVTNGGDFARPSLYTVSVTGPSSILSETTTAGVQAITSPGFTINTLDSRDGKTILEKIPNDVVFDPIVVTFQLSADHSERNRFLDWAKLIFDIKTNTFNYYDKYVGKIVITTLDRQRNITSEQELIDAYPSIVGPIELGYDKFDEIVTFDVTFTYRYWVSTK